MMERIKSVTEIKPNVTPTLDSEIKRFASFKCRSTRLENILNALLTLRPTSVNSERVFSVSGNIISKTRNRLNRTTADALVFLKYYFINNPSK